MARCPVDLTRACGFICQNLFKESTFVSRPLIQHQFTRHGRRTCRPRPLWAPKKKGSPFWHMKELTAGNRAFLKEQMQDEYTPVVSSPLREPPIERNDYKIGTVRTGLIGVKIGVIPQWNSKTGRKFFVTLIQILDNHVIKYTPPEIFTKSAYYREKWRPNYGSLVVGALSNEPLQYSKAYVNLFSEAGVPPKRKLSRFLISPDAAITPGTPLNVNHFRVGDYVDVQAKTIGHGFQGVVKRWGFKGGPASHGTTKWHRRPGAMGGGGDKAAIWKGKKMPGHMGMEMRTLLGLRIWRINTKYNVLYVQGPNHPGPTHCYMRIMDSRLHQHRGARVNDPPPMPTWYPDDAEELPEEIFHDNIHQFDAPTLEFDAGSDAR